MTIPIRKEYVQQIRADRAHGGPTKEADRRARHAASALQGGRPSEFTTRLGETQPERIRAVAALHRLYHYDKAARHVLEQWPSWVPDVVYADVPEKMAV